MELIETVAVVAASAIFIAAGIYLHILRQRSERVLPSPFVNPPHKRKKTKKP
ncbi:MAG: hypothetical protein J7K54_04525 [Candidatus Aenigmarchaeota archaeon]|nr:hypothetical protein [Candidatus Aenigmarchaeota archaeon]